MRSLVCTRETGLDSHAVVRHVLVNPLPDGLAARDDGVPSTVLPHGLGGEVGVRPGAVPVAQDRLGLQGRVDIEVLGNAEQQPAGDPEVVADERRRKHTDLELPLTHHHFGVGALYTQPGLQAGGGVTLDDVPPRHFVAAHAAVVRTLWSGETGLGPPHGPPVLEEGVFLLNPEDRLLIGVLLRRLRARPARIGRMRGEVGEQDLAHHQFVALRTQGVRADENGLQHAV